MGGSGGIAAKESGAAIIIAVLTLALVASLASFAIGDYGAAVASISGRHEQTQARLLGRNAIDWASDVLAMDAQGGDIDHLGEAWTAGLRPTPIDGGAVATELADVSGHFDLNSLVSKGVVEPQRLAAYARLLGELGVPASQASALGAALAGALLTSPGNAAGAENSPAAASVLLIDLDELQRLPGYSIELIGRLRPFAVALPAPAPLNVNTASAEVLAAVIPGLGIGAARDLTEQRQSAPFRDVDDFVARLARPDLKPLASALSVKSRYFIVSARVRYGQAITRLQALLDREKVWPEIVWEKIL